MDWAAVSCGARPRITTAISERTPTRRPSRLIGCLHSVAEVESRPDEPGGFCHARELAMLILGGDTVAGHGRGEAALRAHGEAVERDQPRGLRDALPQLIDGLDARLLRRHQPEHDEPVLGDRAQRLEAPRARVVVLEEEALEPGAAEHPGDRLVAAARVEHGLVVAAAYVQPEGHLRVPSDDGIVHLDARVDEPIGIA